jgi:predicted Zn-ribbon and HTH transcriptional regulator
MSTRADNEIEVEMSLGHSELYERYCINCGYDFRDSRVSIRYLDSCPKCDEPIRPPLNLMKEGMFT